MTAIYVALHQQGLYGRVAKEMNESLKCELAIKDLPKTLGEFMNMCIRLDDYMHEYRGKSGCFWAKSPPWEWRRMESMQANEEEPMQLGRARLSPSGQRRRCWAGESFVCGQKGNCVDTWPSWEKF